MHDGGWPEIDDRDLPTAGKKACQLDSRARFGPGAHECVANLRAGGRKGLMVMTMLGKMVKDF